MNTLLRGLKTCLKSVLGPFIFMIFPLHSYGEYQICSHSFSSFEVENEFENLNKECQTNTERFSTASLFAKGSYNKKIEKMIDLRTQILDEFPELVSFSYYDRYNQKHDNAGLIGFRYKNNVPEIWIAYHGTESWGDWMTNLTASKASLEHYQMPGTAHRGFLNRYSQSKEYLMDIIQSKLENLQEPLKVQKNNNENHFDKILKSEPEDFEVEFIFTGHSQGGAISTLAAADFKNSYRNRNVTLITFASPRVVSSEAANFIESLFGNSIFRIWRTFDAVSTVAPGSFGFKHVGQTYKVKPITWVNPKNNHSMDVFMKEAKSPEPVTVKANHRGFWDRVMSTAQSVLFKFFF